eukprot:4748398-Pyramimonas_sp.AAC.1
MREGVRNQLRAAVCDARLPRVTWAPLALGGARESSYASLFAKHPLHYSGGPCQETPCSPPGCP